MKWLQLFARILLGSFFILPFFLSMFGDEKARAFKVGAEGVLLIAPVISILMFFGAISLILGFKARWGAGLILVCLVPMSIYLHAFWKLDDPTEYRFHLTEMFKDFSMMGGLLLIICYGPGRYSIDGLSSRRSGDDGGDGIDRGRR